MFFCCVSFFSCSNTAPGIITTDCKLVFDYEDEKSFPVQKLNVCLKMDSDVRRVENINIYHSKSELRWVVLNPVITQADNYYYAGYTNLQSVPQMAETIPDGEYTVCFMDSAGREGYSKFDIQYDREFASMKLSQFLDDLKSHEPKIYVGIYSHDGTLLYYGVSRKEWNVTRNYENINELMIFSQYKEAEMFRVFYHLDNNVFIMPKVMKSEKSTPSEKDYNNALQKRLNEEMR